MRRSGRKLRQGNHPGTASCTTLLKWTQGPQEGAYGAMLGRSRLGTTLRQSAINETYVRESQKGSRHLTRPARHRGGAAARAKGARRDILVPVLVGRLRGQPHVVDQVLTAMTIPQATEALRVSVGPDTLLCTDGSGALRGAAKALGVTSKSIAVSYGGRVVEGVHHVQTVNSYHKRLQSWLSRGLRGVATKYLPNYLAWMRIAEWYRGT